MDRYEEALAKARAGKSLEEIFPEMKESEDERIRKAIMEVLKRVSGATDVLENQGTTFKKAMIWLEKQKEQKPAEWSEDDKEMVRRAIFYTEQYRTNYGDTKESKECFNWLLDLHRNIRPPFHWKPSREQMGMLLAVINDPNNAGAESCHLMLQSLYADLEKL